MTEPLTDAQIILAHLARIESKVDALSDYKMPRYLTVKQVAKRLNTTVGNIEVMRNRRQFPFFKRGRQVLIKEMDIEKLLVRYPDKDELLARFEELT